MSRSEPLNVAIDAQITPGISGGVATLTMCLVHALGQLQDGDEIYTIIVRTQDQLDWLKRYAGPNQRFVIRPTPSRYPSSVRTNGRISAPALLKRALGPLLPVARYLQRLVSIERNWPEVPISDGFYESLGCDVLHIPTQNFILCALPTVYNPHDLQHLHYPQFWPPSVIAWRETIYPAGCRLANTVIVGSQWIKDDIARQYRVSPEKLQVIPEGPPIGLYEEPSEAFLAQVTRKYQLARPYAVYPAVTWPHKNHLRLLEALAHLRDSGLAVQLVCTGARFEPFWPRIERCIDELRLSSQVKFLGFVPETDLRAILRLSQFLIMPSLFEACSLPVFEAWLEGVPVGCSNAVALPDQVKDAALLFDPQDVTSIARVVRRLTTEHQLRFDLQRLGTRRAGDFDWKRTAKAYRAVYRRAAGFPLTEKDRRLLSRDWMRDSLGKLEHVTS